MQGRNLFLTATSLAVSIALSLPILAEARDHVLIMTISGYPNVHPLPGVAYDEKNAMELAQRLGYDVTGATRLKEQQLSGDGISKAVQDLAQQVQSGDRLFLYYSGHGASFPVAEGCAEALIPYDTEGDINKLVRTSDLLQAVDGMRDKLSDAFIMFDACHSGGHREIVASSGKGFTRGGASGKSNIDTLLSSKTTELRGGEQCTKVSNISAAKGYLGKAQETTSRGVSLSRKRNMIFVAAAREDEEALDQGNKGGLATTAFLECLRSGVVAQSGTGIATVNDIKDCAQQNIDITVPRLNSGRSPHHIEIYGNQWKYYSGVQIASNTSTPAVGQPGAISTATVVVNSFDQIGANSNPNIGFTAWFSKDRQVIGQPVELSYSSKFAGFLSVLYVGSDRKEITSLLSNYEVAPSTGSVIGPTKLTDPIGENIFLVLLTPTRLDIDATLAQAKEGHGALVTATLVKAIACGVEGQRNSTQIAATAGNNSCAKRPTRNATSIQVPVKAGPTGKIFPDGYGASVLRVTGI